MTLRPILLCAAASAALASAAHAQEPDTPAPAPIVRVRPQAAPAPDAATGTATTPQPIHLPARPAQTLRTPAPPSAATPPTTRPSTSKAAIPTATPRLPASAPPQTAPAAPPAPLQVTLNRTTIVIDPAHGGTDSGSQITDSVAEKDITLALAFKLRSLLAARGFTVILTRDGDAAAGATLPPQSLDERAGIANHARAAACLLLHATDAGRGVHLYTSELPLAPLEPATVPWLTAQAAFVAQSQHLAAQLSTALNRARIPTVVSAASVRPVDSLQCPALVAELAPNDGDVATLTDAAYQQHVADALASALTFWQNQVQPIQRAAPPPPPPTPPKPAASPGTSPAPQPAARVPVLPVTEAQP